MSTLFSRRKSHIHFQYLSPPAHNTVPVYESFFRNHPCACFQPRASFTLLPSLQPLHFPAIAILCTLITKIPYYCCTCWWWRWSSSPPKPLSPAWSFINVHVINPTVWYCSIPDYCTCHYFQLSFNFNPISLSSPCVTHCLRPNHPEFPPLTQWRLFVNYCFRQWKVVLAFLVRIPTSRFRLTCLGWTHPSYSSSSVQ